MQDLQNRSTYKGEQKQPQRETKTQDLLFKETTDLDNYAQDLIDLGHLLDKENP